MQARVCPCCQKHIPIKAFLHHILFAKRKISFVANAEGFLCPSCAKPILSAEKKDKIMRSFMYIAIIPSGLFGLLGDISLSLEYLVNVIIVFVLSALILIFSAIKKYHQVDFICNDESSDDFNNHNVFFK